MAERVISQHIQDCFVHLAIIDTKILRTCRQCIKPEYFGSSVTEGIIQLCYSYFDQFEQAPGDHFVDEIVRLLRDKSDDDKELYLAYIDRINKMDRPNDQYVLSRINEFIKTRVHTEAALKFVKLTESGEFEEAEQIMMHAIRTGVQLEDSGMSYFDIKVPTYYNNPLGEALIGLGVPQIDCRLKLKRQQVVCILGGHKGKKSWWMQQIGGQGLLYGYKVLYITHEMTGQEVEMRYDMMFSGLVSKEQYSEVEFKRYNEEGEMIDCRVETVDTVFNLEKVRKSRDAMSMMGGKLMIKKYPMGSCTIGEMERYLDYLEVFEHFIPDIVINDYPDIMSMPGNDNMQQRDRVNELYKHHKRIADERNLLMVVASQTNRGGLEKARLSRKDFAEDIRKLGNVDIVIAITQTEEMAIEQKQRIFIMAGRSDEDSFGCVVSQNIRVGKPVVDSWTERRPQPVEQNETESN